MTVLVRGDSWDDQIMSPMNDLSDPTVDEDSFVLVNSPEAKGAELADGEYLLVTPPGKEQAVQVVECVEKVPERASVVTVEDESSEASSNMTATTWWGSVSVSAAPSRLLFVLCLVAVGMVSLLAASATKSSKTLAPSVPPIKAPQSLELAYSLRHRCLEPSSFELNIVSEEVSSSNFHPEPKPPRQVPLPLPVPVPTTLTLTAGPVIVRPSTVLVLSSQNPREPDATVREDEILCEDQTEHPKSSAIGYPVLIRPPPASRVIDDHYTPRMGSITRTTFGASLESADDAVPQEASPGLGHMILRSPATLTAHSPQGPVVAVTNNDPAATTIEMDTFNAKNQVDEGQRQSFSDPVTTLSVVVRPPTFIASSHRFASKTLEEMFLAKNYHMEDSPGFKDRNITTTVANAAITTADDLCSSPNLWFTRRIQHALGTNTKISRSIILSYDSDEHQRNDTKDDRDDDSKQYVHNSSSSNLVLHQDSMWPPLRDWKQILFENSHALIRVRRTWKRWCEIILKRQQERRLQKEEEEDDGDLVLVGCRGVLKDFAKMDAKMKDGYASVEKSKQVVSELRESSSLPLLATWQQVLLNLPSHADHESLFTVEAVCDSDKRLGHKDISVGKLSETAVP